jgi:hypothetical protein
VFTGFPTRFNGALGEPFGIALTTAEIYKLGISAINQKKDYRTIQVNNAILEHRPKTLEALTSEEGTLLRMNRSIQVEGVFGVLK